MENLLRWGDEENFLRLAGGGERDEEREVVGDRERGVCGRFLAREDGLESPEDERLDLCFREEDD